MWNIMIKGLSGPSYIYCDESDSELDVDDLSKLDGIDCQDDFVEYIDEPLKSKLDGGYMCFKYENGELYTITQYTSSEELTEEELKELIDYTQGQWADGIGEGFEQCPCTYINDNEVYLSPWYFGQEVKIYQNMEVNLKNDIWLMEFDTKEEMLCKLTELNLHDVIYASKLDNITEEIAKKCVDCFRNNVDNEYYLDYSCTQDFIFEFKTAKQSIKSACDKKYCIIYKD